MFIREAFGGESGRVQRVTGLSTDYIPKGLAHCAFSIFRGINGVLRLVSDHEIMAVVMFFIETYHEN